MSVKRYKCQYCRETVRETSDAIYHSHPVCAAFRAAMAERGDVGPCETIAVLDAFNAGGVQVDVIELGKVPGGFN